MGPGVHYRVHKSPPYVPVLSKTKKMYLIASYFFNIHCNGAAIAQSVLQLCTGWTVRGSNPGGEGDEIVHVWPTQLLYSEYRAIPGG